MFLDYKCMSTNYTICHSAVEKYMSYDDSPRSTIDHILTQLIEKRW